MNDRLFTHAAFALALFGALAFVGCRAGWFGSPEWALRGAAFSAGAVALMLNVWSWRSFVEIFVHKAPRAAGNPPRGPSIKPRVYALIALKILFVLLIVGILFAFGGGGVIPALCGYLAALFFGVVLGTLFPRPQSE